MTDLRSKVNAALRRVARVLPPSHPIRRGASNVWTWCLNRSGRLTTISVADHPLKVVNRLRHLSPDYERDTLTLWLRLLRTGDVVWDVGANIGVYTVLSGRAVGPTGAVVAWEPAPGTFAVLTEHVAGNGMAGCVTPVHAAVADTDGGTVRFTVSAGDETSPVNRIRSTADGSQTVDVPVGTLDAWLRRLGRPPRWVKIDIEGAEVDALRGAAGLLGAGGPRPGVLLAVHPMFLPEFGRTPAEVAELVAGYDYLSFDPTGRRTPPVGYAEYLLLPRERAAEVVRSLAWAAPDTSSGDAPPAGHTNG